MRRNGRGALLSGHAAHVEWLAFAPGEQPQTRVLASASDYFRQLFTGPWRTQVDDGTLAPGDQLTNAAGEVLVEYGAVPGRVFLLTEGACVMGHEKMHVGSWFGEGGALFHKPSSAAIVARRDGAACCERGAPRG